MTVLLLTGPLWVSLGLFHTTRFTPDFFITLQSQDQHKVFLTLGIKKIRADESELLWPTHLPPSRSIRSFSLGSSGLWSWVTSRACSAMSESFSFTPTTTAESPTWATYIWTPRMTMTLAVVPDVLGRPVMVFGHSAVGGRGHKGEAISVKRCW